MLRRREEGGGGVDAKGDVKQGLAELRGSSPSAKKRAEARADEARRDDGRDEERRSG